MVEAPEYQDRSGEIIAACIEVHRQLGPGLLESIYERCLARELELRCVEFSRQQALPVTYKGVSVGFAYRSDLTVANQLIVEVKSVDALLPIHEAQLKSYLRLAGLPNGLLINFNVLRLKEGVRRLSNPSLRPLPDRTITPQ